MWRSWSQLHYSMRATQNRVLGRLPAPREKSWLVQMWEYILKKCA